MRLEFNVPVGLAHELGIEQAMNDGALDDIANPYVVRCGCDGCRNAEMTKKLAYVVVSVDDPKQAQPLLRFFGFDRRGEKPTGECVSYVDDDE